MEKMQGCEEVVQEYWNTHEKGFRVYKFHKKLQQCRVGLMECRKKESINPRIQVDNIKRQMKNMQKMGAQRDLEAWIKLRSLLDETYKAEEKYWSKKSRVEWLQAGDKNTKYFHVVISQRRRMNKFDRLENQERQYCEGEQAVAQEIFEYFKNLFTTSNPVGGETILEGIQGESLIL